MRALIVDDEPTVCLLLSRILARDLDCEVTNATNGSEALDLLARESYDFMLLDLLMPVMSGLETLQAIRRDRVLRDLPVMIMSTVREEARVREAIQLGVGTYVTKPLRPMDVTERLTRFVSSLRATGVRPAPPRPPADMPGPRLRKGGAPGDRPCGDASRAEALRAHLQGAALQVFGLQLGLQVEVDPGACEAAPGDEVAFVPLAMTRPDADYRVLLRAAPAVAHGLAARGRPGGAIDDAAVVATLQDLVWMIASRMLAALRTGGDAGELDAPASTRWTTPAPDRDGATLAEVGLVSTGGDVRCSVLVRGMPRGGTGRTARLP